MIPLPWLGAGAAGLALVAALGVQTLRLSGAHTDLARAEGSLGVAQQQLVTSKLEFDGEKKAAIDTLLMADRCAKDNLENGQHYSAAIGGARAENLQCRQLLRKCGTAPAIVERLAAEFP